MGRGRQKAKQTKVARELKYYSPETDYDALQHELSRSNGHDADETGTPDNYADDGDDDDDYAEDYADKRWSERRR